jgi:hypothetical protein
MSKRTAFSRKSEQKHWRLRHDREELEREQRRVQKWQRKAVSTSEPDAQVDRDEGDEPGAPAPSRE